MVCVPRSQDRVMVCVPRSQSEGRIEDVGHCDPGPIAPGLPSRIVFASMSKGDVTLVAMIIALALSAGVHVDDASAKEYLCLWGAYRVKVERCITPFSDIPFEASLWMIYDCPGTEGCYDPVHPDLVLPDEYVGPYARLHVLQHLGHAADAPQGLIAGEVFVQYTDGTETTYDLVVGVNTAEWAYDRWDVVDCLQHERVPASESWESTDSRGGSFLGHRFYVSVDLDPMRSVLRIGFRLSTAACSLRPQCGYGELHSWFRVHIDSLTLEPLAPCV
jgi:hypothetical protein